MDNAAAESFNSTVEFELLRSNHFATREQARRAVAGWIDEYNTVRRHATDQMLRLSHLGLRTPPSADRAGRGMSGQAGDAPRRLRVRPSGVQGRCAMAGRP